MSARADYHRMFGRAVERVRNAEKGWRAVALYREAQILLACVRIGVLEESEVVDALRDACEHNGLIHDEGEYLFNKVIIEAK